MNYSGNDTPGLKPGQPAPVFHVNNQYGESVSLHTLFTHPYTGNSLDGLLLVFYPYAFTNVCTGELKELQEYLPQFEQAGIRVAAISMDSSYALKEFAHQHGFEFDLLSDFWPHGHVAKQYGVLDSGLGVSWRISFLIGSDGLIRERFAATMDQPRPMTDYLTAINL
ncbi:redoxin domain-containing protein [Micrococcoides hystricis]|uniref:thioredoxin-dependent peroxiredoxin n=1 Tax=Micrococcoides hystricis TaxID=1572761 RepID=A0ABV6PCA2_9MICC